MRVWELVSLALIVQQKPNLKWKKKLFEIVFIQKIFRARRVSKTIINAVEWWFGFVRRKRRVRPKSGLLGRRFADRISGHAPGLLVGGQWPGGTAESLAIPCDNITCISTVSARFIKPSIVLQDNALSMYKQAAFLVK